VAAVRSIAEGERMSDDVRWIRSYVTAETDGRVGTVCVYQATSPEAIRRHASAAELPLDEIVKVGDTVIVRPDPEVVAA
jgi:sporulation protein YlmC with PRC-barrel domain